MGCSSVRVRSYCVPAPCGVASRWPNDRGGPGGRLRGNLAVGRDYQAARDEGLSDSDIRTLLDDHGLAVAEVDPLWSWLPAPPTSWSRPNTTPRTCSPSTRTFCWRCGRRRPGPFGQRGRHFRGRLDARPGDRIVRGAAPAGHRARAAGAVGDPALVRHLGGMPHLVIALSKWDTSLGTLGVERCRYPPSRRGSRRLDVRHLREAFQGTQCSRMFTDQERSD